MKRVHGYMRKPRLAVLASLAVSCSLAAAHAAQVTGVRLTAVSMDSVTFAVALDGPGAVALRHGEAPMAWGPPVESPQSGDRHELTISDLVPDTQYFYQVELDGQPAGDVLTFKSGRSWAARDATILVTADLPDGGPGEQALADRLFAEQADALVIVGARRPGERAGPASEEDLRRLHGRSMTDRLVIASTVTRIGHDKVSDVLVTRFGEEPSRPIDAQACWMVTESPGPMLALPRMPELANAITEIEVATGATASIEPAVDGAPESVSITLDDARPGAAAPAHYAKLRITNGTATITLHDASGAETSRRVITRTCPTPASTQKLQQAFADDPTEAGTSDLDLDTKDCDG